MSTVPARWARVLKALEHGLKGSKWRAPDAAGVLTQQVYEQHFARWTAPSRPMTSLAGSPAFVESVALAVSDAWLWEPGWEVIEHAGGQRFVHNGYVRMLVNAANEVHPPDAPVGELAAVLMPCLREGLMPGFLYAFSRAGQIDPGAPHVRIYLNVRAGRAAQLLRELLTRRALAKLRFETKIPNDPTAFQRCDTMLIYVEPAHAKAMLAFLLRERRRGTGWRRATPFAALEVAPGIALAESPPLEEGEARSLGLHRSSLVARAALAAHLERADAHEVLLALMVQEGVDPMHAHAQRLPASFWRRLTPASL